MLWKNKYGLSVGPGLTGLYWKGKKIRNEYGIDAAPTVKNTVTGLDVKNPNLGKVNTSTMPLTTAKGMGVYKMLADLTQPSAKFQPAIADPANPGMQMKNPLPEQNILQRGMAASFNVKDVPKGAPVMARIKGYKGPILANLVLALANLSPAMCRYVAEKMGGQEAGK
jgi:hypothetical protein